MARLLMIDPVTGLPELPPWATMITQFATQMRREMHANAYKGNAWRALDQEQHDAELMYHVLKLIYSARAGHTVGVLEHAADVGNCAAMMADKHGVLGAVQAGNAAVYGPMAGLHGVAEKLLGMLPPLEQSPDWMMAI